MSSAFYVPQMNHPSMNGTHGTQVTQGSSCDYNKEMLNDYKGKIEVMSKLCHESSGHFSGIKNMLVLPSILISAALVILNALATNQDDEKIKEGITYTNIVLNAIGFILVSWQNQFKIAEKAQNFKDLGDSFIKLHHSIDRSANSGTLNNQFLNNLIDKYDNFLSQCDSFPGNIVNKIQNQYKDSPTELPMVLTSTIVHSS